MLRIELTLKKIHTRDFIFLFQSRLYDGSEIGLFYMVFSYFAELIISLISLGIKAIM